MCPFLFHFLVATAAIMLAAHNSIVALFLIQFLFVVPNLTVCLRLTLKAGVLFESFNFCI
jgi:hypothetical protein